MDISVQSYDVYLNGKFFADRMLNQKNIKDQSKKGMSNYYDRNYQRRFSY